MSDYTELAKKVPWCMGCRVIQENGIVLAHRNRNAWGLRFGRGIKTHDILGAFLCPACHKYGDGPGRNDYNWWELAVHRSLAWALENYYITVVTHCSEGPKCIEVSTKKR
jgi:hypothetical protein